MLQQTETLLTQTELCRRNKTQQSPNKSTVPLKQEQTSPLCACRLEKNDDSLVCRICQILAK